MYSRVIITSIGNNNEYLTTRRKRFYFLVDENGYTEIKDGVLLHNAENLIADQISWDESDSAKNTDLTEAPYWVTTNDGKLLPVADSEALLSALDE